MKKHIIISDVDGCLTDGKFVYTAGGKVAKIFGPHDADGVKLLKKYECDVQFISADIRGYDITRKRIDDMHCPLSHITEANRKEYLQSIRDSNPDSVLIFFGDGIHDAECNDVVDFFIAPKNARVEAKSVACYVTPSNGGEGAFLDMAIWIRDNIIFNNNK